MAALGISATRPGRQPPAPLPAAAPAPAANEDVSATAVAIKEAQLQAEDAIRVGQHKTRQRCAQLMNQCEALRCTHRQMKAEFQHEAKQVPPSPASATLACCLLPLALSSITGPASPGFRRVPESLSVLLQRSCPCAETWMCLLAAAAVLGGAQGLQVCQRGPTGASQPTEPRAAQQPASNQPVASQ